MLPKVREDVHVVEVAVDGVEILQDRKTIESNSQHHHSIQ